MNIVKSMNQYNGDYVFFSEPIKNNIMNNGNFIRIIYSTELFTLNGIYIYITINSHRTEKYYNKYKCCFDINSHKELIYKIKEIEDELLNKVKIDNKTPQFKLSDQMCNGNIKIFSDNLDKVCNSNTFLLKISGIWEIDTYYGLTYKFQNISN